MNSCLDELLVRLDSAESNLALVSSADLQGWPDHEVEWLLATGVLAQAEPARSVTCPECFDDQIADVSYAEGYEAAPASAFLGCPTCGPVPVESEFLRRWRISFETLAHELGQALGAGSVGTTLIPGRLIDMGLCRLGSNRVRVLFARCLEESDASQLHDEIAKAIGASEAVVMTPCYAPSETEGRLQFLTLRSRVFREDSRLSIYLTGFTTNIGIELDREFVFIRQGQGWRVRFGATFQTVRHSKGMTYLAALLQHPHVGMTPSTLRVLEASPKELPGVSAGEALAEGLRISHGGDAGEIADAKTLEQLKLRATELAEMIRAAREGSDSDAEEKCLDELEAITSYVRAAEAKGGRRRRALSHTDRARTSVTNAITVAIKNIATVDASMADHLTEAVDTGATCIYSPRHSFDWQT